MTCTNPIIQNKNSVAEMLADDIFYIKYHEDTYSDVEDFKEGYNSYLELTEGKTVKVLVEMGRHATVTTEAREYAQENKIPAVAEALVLYSLPQRILFKFYGKFRRQNHPLRVFKSFDEALNWLKSI